MRILFLKIVTWIALVFDAIFVLWMLNDDADTVVAHPLYMIPFFIASAWILIFFHVNEEYYIDKYED